jgi:site-specific DNA-cytosine methylase
VRGRRVACGWFSPDCTYFSKARGKKPFRDRNKARRIRGLAWEMLRFALEVKKATGEYPRCLFMENVEEIQDWCPIGKDGQPDWSKRGKNFKAWVARWKNLGAAIEWKELRAMWYGAPTSSKRLFVIVGSTDSRSSGRSHAREGPAAVSHGRRVHRLQPAGAVDLPDEDGSDRLGQSARRAEAEASAGDAVAAPRRARRHAVRRQQPAAVHRLGPSSGREPRAFVHEPIRTIPASDREFAVVEPVAGAVRRERASAARER